MSKLFKGNEDWIKRGGGRIPTKGALAAERASAGLGTSHDDETHLREPPALLTVWSKHAPRKGATR
jgi:hypothetical protein